jgi:nitronate monooxygenase
MAGVSTPQLAAAVSNAGGLGSLAVGAMDAASAKDAVTETMMLTARPICVNVFVHQPPRRDAQIEARWLAALTPLFARFDAQPPAQLREIYQSFLDDAEMLEMLLATRPAAVSFHFGLPQAAKIAALKANGTILLASATSLAEAQLVAAAGIDVIVAQGIEAGGHFGAFTADASGGLPTMVLLPQIVRAVDVPVVAAGGIADGSAIAAVLALGAAGAQLGTAFIGCPETLANAEYRSRLRSGDALTKVTRALSGRPARGIDNALFAALGELIVQIPDYPLAYDATKALVAVAGESEFSVMLAGTALASNRELSAADLVAVLAEETAVAVRQRAGSD